MKKKDLSEALHSVRMRAARGTAHISGAEGIYPKKKIPEALSAYMKRALAHAKGAPDKITLTVEPLKKAPLYVEALPVFTLEAKNPREARKMAARILSGRLGIAPEALRTAFRVISRGGMRGGALVEARTGRRVEPDSKRGIRVSTLGITKEAEATLSRGLSGKGMDYGINGINHPRVKDALIVASKAATASGVVAEMCVSDDPGYTTGYIASRGLGYIRLLRIKEKGSPAGGRVFFVRQGASLGRLIGYLEKTPVMVGKISEAGGIIAFDELCEHPRRCGSDSEPRRKKILRPQS